MNNTTTHTELATFGAGCFWGVESTFRQLDGVVNTAVGYMGGSLDNPTYKDVCTDTTGHAEVVQIEFDPTLISYQQLLDTFFQCHNPTEKNRQGPDVGSQYRSVIFFHNEEQQQLATAHKDKLAANNAIATEVVPATKFYLAEDYHQQYLEKRGLTSCRIKKDN